MPVRRNKRKNKRKNNNSPPGVIKGVMIDQNNRLTGKTINIKVSNIMSVPCFGGCGYSKAECYLAYHACQNWICERDNCTGLLIRLPMGDIPLTCESCDGSMQIYKKN